MAVVDLMVGKRQFQLACQDGEENHLIDLASRVDRRLEEITKAYGSGNDKMLLLMAALTMEDEIKELKEKRVLSGEITLPERPQEITLHNKKSENLNNQYVSEAIKSMEVISDYIENIAEKLEKA